MIALFLSPIYIIGNIYLCRRTFQWLSACTDEVCHPVLRMLCICIYGFLTLSIGLAFVLPASAFQRFLNRIGAYWLGILLYALLVFGTAELIGYILKVTHKIPSEILNSKQTFIVSVLVCIFITAALCLCGISNASHIHQTAYKISIDKDGGKLDELDIALVADLHLGYTIGPDIMQQMVEKINAGHPDIVLIAGDIFDNDYDALDDPETLIQILSQIQSTYGTYAVYGNHDIDEKILAGFTFPSKENKVSDPRMDSFLDRSGIQLINEKTLLIDGSFYLVGRADAERPGRGVRLRKTPHEIVKELDNNKPVIVMEHEPRALQEIADAGIDLHLCGHTHDGQTFPTNLFFKLIWENPSGCLKKENTYSIVTSGVGLFGPHMRLGTNSEVVHINLHFTGN